MRGSSRGLMLLWILWGQGGSWHWESGTAIKENTEAQGDDEKKIVPVPVNTEYSPEEETNALETEKSSVNINEFPDVETKAWFRSSEVNEHLEMNLINMKMMPFLHSGPSLGIKMMVWRKSEKKEKRRRKNIYKLSIKEGSSWKLKSCVFRAI